MDLWLIAPLVLIQVILAVLALVDLFRREPARVRGPRWLWLAVIVLTGIIGPVAYFGAGRRD